MFHEYARVRLRPKDDDITAVVSAFDERTGFKADTSSLKTKEGSSASSLKTEEAPSASPKKGVKKDKLKKK